jgi:TPR repeat protein
MWSFIKNQIENVGSAISGVANAHAGACEDESLRPQLSAYSAELIYEEATKFMSASQYAAAASKLSTAVASGHPRAHAVLSWLLLWGRDGVFIDSRKAFQLANRGSQMGCDWSKGVLAYCYMCGFGVAANEEAGFELACESSSTNYGQFCLGYAHFYGVGGAPKNNTLALKHFASAQGNAEAQHYVGHMLEKGIGVPPNKIEALTWYKAAAAQGSSAAVVSMQRLLPRKVQKLALEFHFKQLNE